MYSNIFRSNILFHIRVRKSVLVLLEIILDHSRPFLWKSNMAHKRRTQVFHQKGNQNPTSCMQHLNVFQARPFEVPRIACILGGWGSVSERHHQSWYEIRAAWRHRFGVRFAHSGIDRSREAPNYKHTTRACVTQLKRNGVFCDATPCCIVTVRRRFRRTCYHLQENRRLNVLVTRVTRWLINIDMPLTDYPV